MNIKLLVISMRPKQWIKNLFILAPLAFSHSMLDLSRVLTSLAAFVCFCFLSSAIYLINDVGDRQKDQAHPTKKNRPIASGTFKAAAAINTALVFILVGLGIAAFLNIPFLLLALLYVLMMTTYSFALRNMVIVDVLTISLGFVLRVIAGCVAITVEISPWIFMCTLFLSLFIALAKRKTEISALKDNALAHRPLFKAYSPALLDGMMYPTLGCIIISYSLYTISIRTIEKVGTKNLIFTIPFVLYGIFRYLYLAGMSSKSTEELLLEDKPLLLNLLAWGLSIIVILYLLP